jgi:multicomponent Na+:H+ antiporter subunit E
MKHALALWGILFAVWLLWSGQYDPVLLTIGLLSCLATVGLLRRMRVLDEEALPLFLLPRLLIYLPWLAIEVMKSNIDLTWRILHPRLPIQPALILLRTGQRTDVGSVLLANSITLTPGTVSVEVSRGEILVHAISKSAADGLQSGEMDHRVCAVEGSR